MEIAAGIAGSVVQGMFASDAADKQASANSQAIAVQQDALNFQKQRYEKWQQIYGPLQEDLVTYVKNLNGNKLSDAQVTRIQAGIQKAHTELATNLAQKGLQNSGLDLKLNSMLDYKGEIAKANAREAGDLKAFNMQNAVLNAGMGLEQSAAAGVANGSANLGNTIRIAGNQEASTQAQLGNFWGSSVAGLLSKIGTTDITKPDLY